jgi:hypothetical protein
MAKESGQRTVLEEKMCYNVNVGRQDADKIFLVSQAICFSDGLVKH